MNVNLTPIQAEIDASREILQKRRTGKLGPAVLLPDEEVIGVYQVWFPVDDVFVHVEPDGSWIEQTEVLPEHFSGS